MMAAGRGVVAAAAAAVAVALLLAGGADADCFDYCFKDCITRDKSMTDYCNYACNKLCEPDDTGALHRASSAGSGGALRCQLSCARASCHGLREDGKAMEACYGQCFAGCKAKALPRPLRADAGVHADSSTLSVTKRGGGAAHLTIYSGKDGANHPCDEKRNVIRPQPAVPDHPLDVKQVAVLPSPDFSPHQPPCDEKQDGMFHPEPDHPFDEKQDAVRPAPAVPDHP